MNAFRPDLRRTHPVFLTPGLGGLRHLHVPVPAGHRGRMLGTQDEYTVVRGLVKGGPAEKGGELKPGGRSYCRGEPEPAALRGHRRLAIRRRRAVDTRSQGVPGAPQGHPRGCQRRGCSHYRDRAGIGQPRRPVGQQVTALTIRPRRSGAPYRRRRGAHLLRRLPSHGSGAIRTYKSTTRDVARADRGTEGGGDGRAHRRPPAQRWRLPSGSCRADWICSSTRVRSCKSRACAAAPRVLERQRRRRRFGTVPWRSWSTVAPRPPRRSSPGPFRTTTSVWSWAVARSARARCRPSSNSRGSRGQLKLTERKFYRISGVEHPLQRNRPRYRVPGTQRPCCTGTAGMAAPSAVEGRMWPRSDHAIGANGSAHACRCVAAPPRGTRSPRPGLCLPACEGRVLGRVAGADGEVSLSEETRLAAEGGGRRLGIALWKTNSWLAKGKEPIASLEELEDHRRGGVLRSGDIPRTTSSFRRPRAFSSTSSDVVPGNRLG